MTEERQSHAGFGIRNHIGWAFWIRLEMRSSRCDFNVAGGRFSSSLAGVRTLDGYEGYLDRWGHWALPPKRIGSRNVFPFVGSLAQTFLHGPNPKRYALINKLGEDVYEWQWQGDDLRKLCPSGKRV